MKEKFLKSNAINKYVTEDLHFRISQRATSPLLTRINFIVAKIITEAKKLSEDARRRTITEQDMLPTIEKHVGKRHLLWNEILSEVLLQPPSEIGKITKGINDYIQQHPKARK